MMMRIVRTAILGVSLVLPACGGGDADPRGGGAASPAGPTSTEHSQATAPTFWSKYDTDPDFAELVDLRLAYDGRSAWGFGGRAGIDDEIRCEGSTVTHSPLGTSGSTSSVDLSPYEVTCVHRWRRPGVADGRDLTIVTGYDSQANSSVLTYFWSKADGSVALDDTSRQDVETTSGARFVGLAIDHDRSRIYLADVARFLLLRVDDTDQDGVPDTVATAPAAEHPTYCGDIDTGDVPIGIAYLSSDAAAGIMPFTRADPVSVRPTQEVYRGRPFWKDVDGDGEIDEVTTWTPQSIERVEANSAYVGTLEVSLDSTVGASREVWVVNAAQTQLIEKLADLTVAERPESVSLTRALAPGEVVALTTDGGGNVLSASPVIAAPIPELESVSPTECVLNGGVTTIQVVGRRFQPGITVRLLHVSTLVATGVVTSQSATQLTVDLPNISDGTKAHLGLHLEFANPGAPNARTTPFFLHAP